MAPRPRQRSRRHWPDNLYPIKRDDGRVYYVYRYPKSVMLAPDQKRTVGLGYDFDVAKQAAKDANEQIQKKINLVERMYSKGGRTFSDYLQTDFGDHLKTRRINGQPLSMRTLEEYGRIIRNIVGHFGDQDINQVEIADVRNCLDKFPIKSQNKNRAILMMAFDYAIADGIRDHPKGNPASMTMTTQEPEKDRQRLSLDGYKAIFQHAPRSLQIAMELSLNVMQRREDVRNWPKAKADPYYAEDPAHAHVIISKTKKHGKEAYLRIPYSLPVIHSEFGCKTLDDIIALGDKETTVISPYVVHHKPARKRENKEKSHWTQLSPEQISKGFAKARKESDYYSKLSREEVPTFHEIIALGEHLRLESGWTVEQIQQLRGHKTTKMTKKYLEGHDWTTFEVPGLG